MVKPIGDTSFDPHKQTDGMCPMPLDSLSNWGLSALILRKIATAHARNVISLVEREPALTAYAPELNDNRIVVAWVSNEFHERPVGRDLGEHRTRAQPC